MQVEKAIGFLAQTITTTSSLASHPGHEATCRYVPTYGHSGLLKHLQERAASSLRFDKALVNTLYSKPQIVLHVSSFYGTD